MANEGSIITFNPQPQGDVENRRNWQTLSRRLPPSTHSATRAPNLSTDDITDGWRVGSIWINTAETPPGYYVNIVNTEGAPKWGRITNFQIDFAGSGQIAGGSTPSTLVANGIIRAFGTAGEIQGSVVTIDDAGVMSGVTNLPKIYDAVAVQSITAAATAITATDGSPYRLVSSDAAYTLSAEPTIAAGRNGQAIFIKNVGSFNIILQDVNALGGSLLRMTANTLTIQAGGTMALIYDSTIGFWIEQWLLNPQTFTPSVSSLTSQLATTREVATTSTLDTAPNFTIAYVGTPSTASIDVSAGGDPSTLWPITVPSPYTALNGGTTPPTQQFVAQDAVNTTRVFTVTATVAGTVGLTRTLTFTYLNRRYLGPHVEATALTSANVLALDGAGGSSGLSNSRTGTFTGITIGATEYLWYAVRAALGTGGLFLSIAGEIAGFDEKQTTLSHTNDSSFVENFNTWRSTNQNLGAGVTAVVATAAPNNRIYIGPGPVTDPISNANILALDDTVDGESIVSNTIARTYTAIQIEAGEYLWFVHPDRIADLATIKDGTTGFGIDGAYMTDVTHTNQYGYAETYRCWRSTNSGIFPTGENIVVT